MLPLVNLELSGDIFELREVGDVLSDEIAILPDGHYEILSSHEVSGIYGLLYKYSVTGERDDWFHPENYEDQGTKVIKYRPILDRISKALDNIKIPGEGEIAIYPVLDILGYKI